MPTNDPDGTSGNVRIPLAAERLEAHVRKRQDGVVRITKRVESEPVETQVDLRSDEVVVERLPRDEVVSATRPPWHDGDTLVIPVYEERLVVEKRLVLTEEIRVRRTVTTETVDVRDTVRREVAELEPKPAPES